MLLKMLLFKMISPTLALHPDKRNAPLFSVFLCVSGRVKEKEDFSLNRHSFSSWVATVHRAHPLEANPEIDPPMS
jgi:hypothetical protein